MPTDPRTVAGRAARDLLLALADLPSRAALRVPPQEYSFGLVRRAIERKALVVLMRGRRRWLRDVPELGGYPVLGLAAFEKPQPAKEGGKRYYLRARGIEAEGYEDPSGFVVLAGSQVAREAVPSIQTYLLTQRETLEKRGVIQPNGDGLRVSQDYTFDSPSTAAGVLLGRSANGREIWRDADGRTLKENQTAAVGRPQG